MDECENSQIIIKNRKILKNTHKKCAKTRRALPRDGTCSWRRIYTHRNQNTADILNP